ncbi:ChaN family lipoprotein [Solitalea koreensis]|uniref:Uncharacterized iron-regulated protein n=1 Tax=Solitalea koreensis TaxID=543615 RepID=A0A521EBT1_9SPHI|nr:ChaN family lipoprotein [Solitalea koreensis]SMO81394.1 Uncharacterized iron-regulated protein [Solitalea koreensis]
MKKLSVLYLICLLNFLPILTIAQDSSIVHFKIYSTRAGKEVTLSAIVDSAEKVNVIEFGEEHNDSIGHHLEKQLFESLNKRFGNSMALSMEMFERDVQLVLDEYLKGLISEKNFLKDARVWSNYRDYRPLVEFAKTNNLSVIAANAPARYINLVSKEGLNALDNLSLEAKFLIAPLPIDTLSGKYYKNFLKAMGGHIVSGMQIYQSQNLWDASMAHSIISFLNKNNGKKVFQLNGRFHSDEYLGICERLKKSGLKVLTISCFSDESFGHPDYSKFSNLADYIIITDPKIARSY